MIKTTSLTKFEASLVWQTARKWLRSFVKTALSDQPTTNLSFPPSNFFRPKQVHKVKAGKADEAGEALKAPKGPKVRFDRCFGSSERAGRREKSFFFDDARRSFFLSPSHDFFLVISPSLSPSLPTLHNHSSRSTPSRLARPTRPARPRARRPTRWR